MRDDTTLDDAVTIPVTFARVNACDEINTEKCSFTFEGAFECDFYPVLPEHFFLSIARTLPVDITVDARFIHPRIEYWQPWAALFAHTIIQGADVIRSTKNPHLVAGVKEDLDAFEKDISVQRQFLAELRTPRVSDQGIPTLPVFHSLIEQRRRSLAALKDRVDHFLKRRPTPEVDIYTQALHLKYETAQTEAFPPEALKALVPASLADYASLNDADAAKRNASGQYFRNKMRWELSMSLDRNGFTGHTWIEDVTIPYQFLRPYPSGGIDKATWVAKLRHDVYMAPPVLTLSGFLRLPNADRTKEEEVPVVHRSYRGGSIVRRETVNLVNRAPWGISGRYKAKKHERDAYDELLTRVERRDTDSKYAIPPEQRWVLEINNKRGPFYDFWREAQSMRRKGEKEILKKLNEEFQLIVNPDRVQYWENANDDRRVIEEITKLISDARSDRAAEALTAIRSAADRFKYVPNDRQYEPELQAMDHNVRQLRGIERVVVEMARYVLPEILDRPELEAGLMQLPVGTRLLEVMTLDELRTLADPADAADAAIETLARELHAEPARIHSAPVQEEMLKLIGQAKRAVVQVGGE